MIAPITSPNQGASSTFLFSVPPQNIQPCLSVDGGIRNSIERRHQGQGDRSIVNIEFFFVPQPVFVVLALVNFFNLRIRVEVISPIAVAIRCQALYYIVH